MMKVYAENTRRQSGPTNPIGQLIQRNGFRNGSTNGRGTAATFVPGRTSIRGTRGRGA